MKGHYWWISAEQWTKTQNYNTVILYDSLMSHWFYFVWLCVPAVSFMFKSFLVVLFQHVFFLFFSFLFFVICSSDDSNNITTSTLVDGICERAFLLCDLWQVILEKKKVQWAIVPDNRFDLWENGFSQFLCGIIDHYIEVNVDINQHNTNENIEIWNI